MLETGGHYVQRANCNVLRDYTDGLVHRPIGVRDETPVATPDTDASSIVARSAGRIVALRSMHGLHLSCRSGSSVGATEVLHYWEYYVLEPVRGSREREKFFIQSIEFGGRLSCTDRGTLEWSGNRAAWEWFTLKVPGTRDEFFIVSGAHERWPLSCTPDGKVSVSTNRDGWERWAIKVVDFQ